MSKPPTRILVVDDHEEMAELLADELRDSGYDVTTANSGTEAIAHIEARRHDLVLTDLRMRGVDGFDVLEHVRQRSADTSVVVMTAFGDVGTAVEAMKRGAFHYVSKPFKIDEVLLILERAEKERRLQEQNRQLRNVVGEASSLDRIIGVSDAIADLRETIRRLSSVDAAVLIRGESGTGKELVARALHFSGGRADASFVAVNCTALPRDLLESELFGHVRGSFTGAATPRKGLFVEADAGTLFLDEIGDMPLELQAKLLRVLEEGEVRPVGSDEVRRIDVRIVAATHQPLERLAREGKFRQDLLYRLDVLPLHIPALDERRDDIPLLVGHFVERLRERYPNERERRLVPEVVARLAARPWPGNVRQLENAVQRLFLMADSERVTLETYDRVFPEDASRREFTFGDLTTLREMEDRYIRFVLSRCGDNKTRAAEVLGIDPSTLHRRLRED